MRPEGSNTRTNADCQGIFGAAGEEAAQALREPFAIALLVRAGPAVTFECAAQRGAGSVAHHA
jgi:hypothetical protein